MIVNLNTVVPDKLVCPEGKRRIEYVDKGGTGLYCEVRATSPGQGTYYLRYRSATNNNKTSHKKIGRTTDIDLNEARRRAKTLRAEIVLGKDPRAEEKARKAVPTFSDMFQEYMKHAKVHNRGWKKKSQMYDLRLKEAFGNKRLDQIKRHDISSWHLGLRSDGLSPAYADRFLALLRHCLNLAVDWDMLEKNPAAHVKLFNPDNRDEQHLNADELKRLLKVLRTDKNRTVSLIVLFLLSTGCRLNEALQAKWVDIDRDNKVWRIPAANAKSKRSRLAVLNSFAIKDVLDQLDTEGKYDHLFVNRKTGKNITYIHKTWNRLRTESGLPDFKLHSLRRSYASFLVNSGHSLYEASRLLGHSDPSITASRYAVLASDSLQSAAESVGKILNGSMPE
jgi:integrase